MEQLQKRLSKVLIIDGSYMIQRALNVPELWNLKSSKGLRTGGIFGFLRSLNYEFKGVDYYPVVTWDSGLAKRRTEVYERYKRNHIRTADKLMRECKDETDFSIKLEESFSEESTLNEAIESVRETLAASRIEAVNKMDEDDYRAQYRRQRDILITIMNAIGVPSIKVNGWEGDDLMTLLTRISEESIVMTDDKDLIQLIGPHTQIIRPMQKQHLVYDKYLPEQDISCSRELAITKAIEGDGSDNIPGVTEGLETKYRVGHVRAKQIAKIILENNEDPDKYLKVLRDSGKNYYLGFVQRHDDYIRNMKLVDLSLVPNDESVIETAVTEIMARAGKCNYLSAAQMLAEQEITSFDLSAFISKMSILSCSIKAGGSY